MTAGSARGLFLYPPARMKAYEIFRHLSNDEIDAVVLTACKDDEIPDKIAGGVLTYQAIPYKRFARLPEEQRKGYVRRTLRNKRGADLALFVLSAALTRSQKKLISFFLDETGLPHEGPSLSIEGEVPEPSPEKVSAAVDATLKKYEPRDVAIYLHAFSSQPDVRWTTLNERLASDVALRLEDRSAS